MLTQLTRLAGDLNSDILGPHLTQIETLINQLEPILAAAVQSKSTLEGLVTGLRSFVDTIPTAVYRGNLLIFMWLAGLVNDHGGTTNLAASPSLTSVLAPA
jgi:hypothetical protein